MTIDKQRVAELKQREDQRFIEERPKSRALLERGSDVMPGGVPMPWMVSLYDHPPMFIAEAKGAYLTDVDGHRYLDMNLADTSMACGYGLDVVADAVDSAFRKGGQYLLPNEETIDVAEALVERFGFPHWQFTLSATAANAEAIRIARAFTGRERILVFDGKYHGMNAETCQIVGENGVEPEVGGLSKDAGASTDIVAFNDLAAVEAVLARGDTACVMAEAALTNITGVLMPEPGFLDGLSALTRKYGALLVVDEAHTHVCAFGGLKQAWNIDCDILVVGKAIASGVPTGVYGFKDEIAVYLEDALKAGSLGELQVPMLALGGTLFGNPVQIAAVGATLEHVLTRDAQEQAAALGAYLSDGIEAAAAKYGLPWSAHRLYSRSGYHLAKTLPRTAAEAYAVHDGDLRNMMRVYMANRGIWEAIFSASPAVSLAATKGDIDFYLSVFDECLGELTA